MKPRIGILDRIIRPLMLAGSVVASLAFNGCYLVKQGSYYFGYQNRARPVEQLLSDPQTSQKTRDFLARVAEIRQFAEQTIGLKTGKNYTSYVKIDQDFLAYVVQGTKELSFEPYQWWFPFVNSMPYKGFYEEQDARAEAEGLKKQGYEVWIRKVEAFSSLGYMPDPLYSFMEQYPPHRLAELIIHEMTHSTIYLRDQAGFNEELATFVGRQGAILFIEKVYGPDSPERRRMDNEARDFATLNELVSALIHQLDALYKSDADIESKRRDKAAFIQAFKDDFLAHYDERFATPSYKAIGTMAINNAWLGLFRLYHSQPTLYSDLYQACGENLSLLVQFSLRIDPASPDPRLALKSLVAEHRQILQ